MNVHWSQSWNLLMSLTLSSTATCREQGRWHQGGRGGHGHPTFLRSKKRKGRQREKKKELNLSKGCHQGQNIIVLTIPERLEFKIFSYLSTMVTDNTFQCSMSPPPPSLTLPLWNPFRRPCLKNNDLVKRVKSIVKCAIHDFNLCKFAKFFISFLKA